MQLYMQFLKKIVSINMLTTVIIISKSSFSVQFCLCSRIELSFQIQCFVALFSTAIIMINNPWDKRT